MNAFKHVMKFDDLPMPAHENMLQHHAFHIALTLMAFGAISIWWLYDKKQKELDQLTNEESTGSRKRSQGNQK